MGSFYMNCAVTRHPFCYDQEDAVLIPIFVKYSSDRPIYMHDNCSIFPLFVNAKYHDYGQFEVEECPMSERVLDLLAAALENGVTGGRRRGDDEEDEIDIENFNWDTFFDLTHENKSCSYGRISYVAIHKKVFDRIISDYTLYGKLDTSIEGYTPENYGSYGFDHYFAEKIKSMADKKVKADAVSKDYAERIAALTAKELTAHLAKGNDESSFTPSTDLMLLGFRRDMKVNEVLSEPNYGEHAYLQANQLAPELPSLGDEEFLNAQKVNFFSAFMAGINMPWAESVYAGQECDTDGYKVLRNCYADLTVQSTITHFEENCVSKDDVVIDKNDKILMELMDKLNHIDVEYIKE
jgi:hypothetical protein